MVKHNSNLGNVGENVYPLVIQHATSGYIFCHSRLLELPAALPCIMHTTGACKHLFKSWQAGVSQIETAWAWQSIADTSAPEPISG